MRFYRVADELAGMTDAQKNATFTLSDGSTTIMDGVTLSRRLNELYGYFKSIVHLSDAWATFQAFHSADFLRAYAASVAEYNPLNNYDKIEDVSDVERVGKMTVERTPDLETVELPTDGDITTELYTTTFDSTSPRLDSKSVTLGGTTTTENGKDTTETSHGNVSGTDAAGNSVNGTKIVEHKNRTSGNIGVTTSQQMIESEYEMRLTPLLVRYLDVFAREHLYLCEGGEWYE